MGRRRAIFGFIPMECVFLVGCAMLEYKHKVSSDNTGDDIFQACILMTEQRHSNDEAQLPDSS